MCCIYIYDVTVVCGIFVLVSVVWFNVLYATSLCTACVQHMCLMIHGL